MILLKIIKSGEALGSEMQPSSDMDLINSFAKTELSPDDIYTFSVLLCDNDVDRDFERFSESAINELSALFVGKTGIFDHDWKADNQFARIYRTEVVTEQNRKNALGQSYVYLKAFVYMLRTDENARIISDIEGGIKKETSVGCLVSQRLCSICGEEIGTSACSHSQGREYEGRLCFAELWGAVDAYEWSFVAVPAQVNSGVIKKLGADTKSLGEFVMSKHGLAFQSEFNELKKLAESGRAYISSLRSETLRLSLLCDENIHKALVHSTRHMDAHELFALKSAFEAQLESRFPPAAQLPGLDNTTSFEDTEYLI